MRRVRSAGSGPHWPLRGWGVQAGQYRTVPPAFLMALGATGALADPDQGEADLGLSDDGDQPCAVPSGMGVEPVEEILSPADVVSGVPVGLAEMQHDAELPGHGLVLQSTTQATGHAVPHARQVRAISVTPSPVSTSDSVMSSDPQSGQTWAW